VDRAAAAAAHGAAPDWRLAAVPQAAPPHSTEQIRFTRERKLEPKGASAPLRRSV